MLYVILFLVAMVVSLFIWDTTGYVYAFAAAMLSFIGIAAAVYEIFKRKIL